MTLLELGRTTAITQSTSAALPFVRVLRLGPFDVDSGLLSTFPGLDESDRATINVTGVQTIDGAAFSQTASVADCFDRQQSFFWDFSEQTLFVHLTPSENPFESAFTYGTAQGFSSGRVVYVDGIKYEPLITSFPKIRQQQDIENYSKLSFITGTITLNNAGGRLDDLIGGDVYGNDVNLFYLDDQGEAVDDYTADDVTRLATLFVEDYDLSLRELSLRVQDRRKSQNRRIPDDRFNSTDYPDGDSELYGTVIPVVWGTPREIPAIVTNGETTTGNVKLRAATVLTALGTPYAGEEGAWETVTALNTNLATGEFEVSAAEGRDVDGNPLKFKLVSPTGIAITRLTDVIVDANERFLNVAFNDSEYDTTEWTAEAAAVSGGAYYLGEEKDFFELVQDIQNGANVGFRYEIAPDGRRTMRVDDEARAVTASIDSADILNRDELPVKTDSSRLAAEIVVAYDPSYVSGRRLRYVDDSAADTVAETYGQRPRKEYHTLLTAEADAITRAGFVKDRFSVIRGIGEFALMGAEYLGLRIYDLITVDITPDEPEEDARPFFGPRLCKVLSVEPDATRVVNTITAELVVNIDTRITEGSDDRITESGILRATEG